MLTGDPAYVLATPAPYTLAPDDSLAFVVTFTPEVEVADAGTLPRFELKAKRVIRDA